MRNKENNKYPPVVITGLCDPMSLCLIRSLGRRGIPIIAVDSNISSYYGKTKYCEKINCKSLFDSSLIECLLELGKYFERKAVLFNCTDQSVLNVSNNREELEKYYDFVIPPHTTIQQLMSKNLFSNFATNNNFLVPKTFFSHNRQEVESVSSKISYPCVIKPEYRDAYWLEHLPSKILFANSKEEYFRYFKMFDIANRSMIMQEWIKGGDSEVFFCLTYINRNHEPLGVLVGRKIRQHPPGIGSTSLAESVLMPKLADECVRLLKTSGCVGFNSVEFKYSIDEKLFYIIEPTVGRPDTQEGLSVSSGLDIPYLAYLDAIGKNPEPVTHYVEGIKWINEPFDFYSIQAYLKRDHSNLMGLLSAYRGKKRGYALWAVDDPLPFIHFVLHILKRGIKRIIRK
jgi:predicted ATP-grasp superfamily ATP-dependent carboligase